MTRLTGPIAAFSAIVAFLLGLVAAGTRPGDGQAPAVAGPIAPAAPAAFAPPPTPPVPTPAGSSVDFAAVAARVNAAVVNVDAASRGDDRGRPGQRWRRDLSDDPGAPREGSGSGFIIDAAGYILTNFHVIEGADRITVTLGDGRVFRATLVGVDPAIDVALLQIPAREGLPVAASAIPNRCAWVNGCARSATRWATCTR